MTSIDNMRFIVNIKPVSYIDVEFEFLTLEAAVAFAKCAEDALIPQINPKGEVDKTEILVTMDTVILDATTKHTNKEDN